jgi:tetratricopeptide (TPR) repeat protein
MFLTWPDRNAKLAGKSASRSPIPVKQSAKAEPTKSAEIVYIPLETKPEPKPVITEKTPEERTAAPVKKVAAAKQPPKTKPAKATVKSERPKTVVAKTWTTPSDSHDVEKGQALSDKGISLIREGRPGEAIPVLEQSLRSFPKGTKHGEYASALFNLGIAWRMAGRPDIAIPILQKSIKINSQRDEVQRELQTARQQARDAGFGSFQ